MFAKLTYSFYTKKTLFYFTSTWLKELWQRSTQNYNQFVDNKLSAN